MAEAKVSLVKIKELEARLELKEEKKDQPQESERQLAELRTQLKRETQRADKSQAGHEDLKRLYISK